MSERVNNIIRVVRPIAEIIAAGFAAGLLGVAGVTIEDHRKKTHRSLEIHPWLENVINFEQRTLGIGEPNIWAAVHRVHHQMSDATLAPFLHIARAINWLEVNPAEAQGVNIPDTFANLDPYVNRFKLAEVRVIGNQAESFIKERLGENYKAPKGYTIEELTELFNPTEPRYFYPREKHNGKYIQIEIEEILLGDPHSPVRIPPPQLNGVRGVAGQNVGLYSRAADLFRTLPKLMPKDLQREGGNRKATRLDIAAGFLIPSIAVLFAKNKYEPKDILKAIIAGSAINGLRLALEIFGGNVTNSLGHSGMLSERELWRAIQRGEYKPSPNPDGTVSTNTRNAGLIMDIIGRLTLDEVGGQEEHHDDPAKIAYTSKEGWKAWMEAPWGMLLSTLASSKYFPFINPGLGFDLKEGETRPDQPHPALAIIHRLRAEQF